MHFLPKNTEFEDVPRVLSIGHRAQERRCSIHQRRRDDDILGHAGQRLPAIDPQSSVLDERRSSQAHGAPPSPSPPPAPPIISGKQRPGAPEGGAQS